MDVVTIEIALALTLLVGAGLAVRGLSALFDVERGFQSAHRVVFAVTLPETYGPVRTADVMDRFLGRLRALPQVEAASAVSWRPIVGDNIGMLITPAGRVARPDEPATNAGWRLVAGNYFRTLGTRLLMGRTFTERDEYGHLGEWAPLDGGASQWVVVISHSVAERLWPSQDPIGRRVTLWVGEADLDGEVVGVVEDTRERGLLEDATLTVYLPYRGRSWSPIDFVVHTTGSPQAVVPTMRAQLAELDRTLPVSHVQTLDELVIGSAAQRRFTVLVLAIFTGVALVLALAGVYGVQAFTVSRRTSEIGIRIALGGRSQQVLRQVVLQGMRPALLGIGFGLGGAFIVSRVLTGWLVGISPADPLTYTGAVVLLTLTALVSCYVPARRALGVDPVVALRHD